MRGEGDRVTADDVIRMGLDRKHYWERHGTGHWGYGVALDVLALERRVAALERLSCAGGLIPPTVAPLCEHPQPTLTDEEREAIEKAIGRELDAEWYGGPEPGRVVALRRLLERLG